jgi:hypothetical protein
MHTFDPDKPLSAEDRERLLAVAALPDETIDTSDAPELPAEAWKHAVRNPYARLLREQATRKAS